MLAPWAQRSLVVAWVVVLVACVAIAACSRSDTTAGSSEPAPKQPPEQVGGGPPQVGGGSPPPSGGSPPPSGGSPPPSGGSPPPSGDPHPAGGGGAPPAVGGTAPPAKGDSAPSAATNEAFSPKVSKPEPAATPSAALPAFPWPPPRASAEYRINNRWVAAGDRTTLSQVADRIEAALSAAQYETWRYLAVPNGFALVTQIERIDAQGNPRQPRFGTELPSLADMTFVEFLLALGKAPPGYYRVFAFIVTDVPFSQSDQRIGDKEAEQWMRSGLTQLPADVGSLPYGPRHRTTALVYEFSRAAKRPATLVAPSKSAASAHLQRARIWDALSH